MSAVLFWDIDGTLLTTARAGVFALEEAARTVCGTEPALSKLETAGLTDSEVAALVIEHCGGRSDPATVSALLREYERHLPDRLHLRKGRVLPGVLEILDDVATRPGVRSLLLTGNTPAGAQAKLRHYGLDAYFEGGAFCVQAENRESIARRALDLARPSPNGGGPDVFVIGDTPHDVSCGRAIGARTVAVATGVYEVGALEASGAWLTLPRLPAPARFVELLGLP